jgi:ligand-binding sensor domain-containing protein
VVFLVGSLSAAAWSQTGEWTVHNTGNSGLPYNGVTALAIDKQGVVWVGTGRWWAHAGGGLAKFDGTNWAVYNTGNSGLPDNDHVSLSIEPDGNIWSGTEDGLSKFDGTNWTVYKTYNSGLLSNKTGAPAFDGKGNAWIATYPNGGLAKFDGKNWTVYHTGNSGLPHNFVCDVAIDTHGNIWAGTFGGGVARFDGQNWTVYNTGNSRLPHNDVSFLAADSAGNVWAGTYGGGMAKFDGTGWTPYTVANSGLPDNWIWNLSVDPQNSVWAGTKAGLARFDGARWIVYNKGNSGLPDDNVYCAAFDAQGRIWIGTQDGGLAVLRPQPAIDFNGDGVVDIQDLLRLVESWGQDDPTVDIGPTAFGDGVVDAEDLKVLMGSWDKQVQDDTLVAHWKLDEADGMTASDSAGSHDGTVVGSAAWRPAGGAVGGALEFNGTTFVAADFVLNPGKGPFSVLAWLKGGGPGQTLVSQTGGANWLTANAQGALMTELSKGGRSGVGLSSQEVITDGHWHRIACTWDGVNRRLYVDDVLAAEDVHDKLADSYGKLTLGSAKNAAPGTFWSGLIDDVRVYNRAVNP